MRVFPGTLQGLPDGVQSAWTITLEQQLGIDLNDSQRKIFATFYSRRAGVVADIGLTRYFQTGALRNYRLSPETLDSSGLPTGTAFGGGSAFERQIDSANFAWYPVPSANRPTIAVGDRFGYVVGPGTPAPDATNYVSLSHGWSDTTESLWGYPYHLSFDGSWSRWSDYPCVALRLTDGTVLWPGGVSSLTAVNFASPAAYGIEFRSPFASAALMGFQQCLLPGGDFSVRLYRGTETSPLKTTGTRNRLAAVNNSTNYQAWVDFFATDEILAPLTTYYLVVAAETASTLRFAYGSCLSAAERDAIMSLGQFDWFPVSTTNIGTLGTTPFARLNSGLAYTGIIQPILGAITA